MRKCPVCDEDLAPENYEGFRVMRCARCGGHLVPSQRLESIRRVDRKSRDELAAEATAGFQGDTQGSVKCPRCHMPMRKEPMRLATLELQRDVCRGCRLVWLDGGELALLQLAHEATSRFMDAQEFKRRMLELETSPERKARFEEDLARLPEPENPVLEALGEAGNTLLGALMTASRNLDGSD